MIVRTITQILTITILLTQITNAQCPNKAKRFIPIIKSECNKYWKDICPIEIIPAQIQKESDWNIYAERRAGKEYGFGLSQTTIIKGYFNNFLEFKKRWKRS